MKIIAEVYENEKREICMKTDYKLQPRDTPKAEQYGMKIFKALNGCGGKL